MVLGAAAVVPGDADRQPPRLRYDSVLAPKRLLDVAEPVAEFLAW